MNLIEGRGVVGVLLAFYPRIRFERESVEAWGTALADYDLDNALAAANELGRTSRFVPTLAELLDATRRARRERLREEPAALPAATERPYPFARFLADYPEMRARVETLDGSLFGAVFAQILREELGRAA